MTTSTLTPGNFPAGPDRRIHNGHGTRALGPSDSSDSGSDVADAGAALGDAELASDTDRYGTGERSSVEDDGTPDGADIGIDHVEDVDEEEEADR